MLKGVTVTLTTHSINYNLLALILDELGYSVVPATLTGVPQVQILLNGDKPFWPNPVRELQLTGDAGNGAAIITINDSLSNKLLQLIAQQSDTIRSGSNDINLESLYVNTSVDGAKLNVLVDVL